VVSVDAGSEELEQLARHFHERKLEDPPEVIGQLIHPDTEMRLLVNGLQPLQGRHAVIKTLSRVREASIYSAEVERLQWLDKDMLLVSANVRYAIAEGGVSTSRIWWLDEFRDGLLCRVRAFKAESEARNEYRADHSMSEPP
jgi:hypothetical protein